MSAWLAESGHIHILVNALVQYGVAKKGATQRTLDNYGTELWRTNNRSVNHRYRENNRLERYTATTTKNTLSVFAVLKALDSWVYQSCEKPGWEDSKGGKLAARLRAAITREHPALFTPVWSSLSRRHVDAYTQMDSYERADWGPSSLDSAVLVNVIQIGA